MNTNRFIPLSMSSYHFLSVLKEQKKIAFIFFISSFFFISCGNKTGRHSHQPVQLTAHQQAVQDSLALADAKNMAHLAIEKVRKQMSKTMRDTTTRQEAESVSVEKQKTNISDSSNNTSVANSVASAGNYAIQVGSWRSQEIAAKELKKWKMRGYNQAYLAKYGKKSTGDTWYRLRLGQLKSHSAAEQTGEKIAQKYGVQFWITSVQ